MCPRLTYFGNYREYGGQRAKVLNKRFLLMYLIVFIFNLDHRSAMKRRDKALLIKKLINFAPIPLNVVSPRR